MSSRSYVFTWNNFPSTVKAVLDEVPCRYMVYQFEKGDLNEVPHAQGYVEFDGPRRLNSLKKIHKEIHWESRKGTRDQARDYCMKEKTRIDGPYEIGKWIKGQGTRSDLADLLDEMVRTPIQQVAVEHPDTYVRNYRGINHYNCLVNKPSYREVKTEEVRVRPPTEDVFHVLQPDCVGFPCDFSAYGGETTIAYHHPKGNLRVQDLPTGLLQGLPIYVKTQIGPIPCRVTQILFVADMGAAVVLPAQPRSTSLQERGAGMLTVYSSDQN